MKLIVGLGNPGIRYAGSRHNAGFSVIKYLAKLKKVPLKRDFGAKSFSAKFKSGHETVVLSIPLTFMNLSGLAVKHLVRKYKVTPGDLLIVCDDLDLEPGRIKIKPRGSSGGHRGISSVIESLASDDFARLRIGIGRPRKAADAAEYVLSEFNRQEKEAMSAAIERAAECCLFWINEGIEKTMNNFNNNSASLSNK